MSTASALDFIKRVTSDEKFADRLNQAGTANDRMLLAQKEGYEFTMEEFQVARTNAPLSEKELESVSGGIQSGDGSCPDCWWW